VQHLLEHRSGLQTFQYGLDPEILDAFNTAAGAPLFALPVNGRMTDRWMVVQPGKPPGAEQAYSNFGYFLLGHLLMAVTGASSLQEMLWRTLLGPLGITRIRQARSRADQQALDEARYHPTRLDLNPSVMLPDRRLAPHNYGGFWNLDRDDGGGGLSAAVTDVARLLAALDIRVGNPVLQPASIASLFSLAESGGGHGFDTAVVLDAAAGHFYGQKGGDLPESSQNCVRYKTGDISMVVNWNRHDIAEGGSDGWWYPDFPALLDVARAHSWGTTDLFPAFGMPPLV
jgi:CubicO group peptidase (beta-lactamase class C family)